ncbi:MAG: extracellular solute-binding protein [Hyphomicrobiales bacterium]|nr:extracellular solute-binding protein [Hyphomicrobiales bacterium]
MRHPSRRDALKTSAAAALAATTLPALATPAATGTEAYGMSSFGDLAEPANFSHFNYVNPQAPKGGALVIQLTNTTGNQAFDTFDTLNIYVFKGNGAAGMDTTFDTLMTGSADEPDALYGLLAQSVAISADKLTYRFRLDPRARFHDGSKVTAGDVAFSLNILKTQGHPALRIPLDKMTGARAEGDDIAVVTLDKARSRDLHLFIASLPIFSAKWWKGRDFQASTLDAPLGSGPYKVRRFDTGRSIEFELVADYWGKDLPVNVGQNNFAVVRYEYFRDRTAAFEAFKAGSLNFRQEFTAKIWHTSYDFPAIASGAVKHEALHSGRPVPTQGWFFNTRHPVLGNRQVREAIGLLFDFEWTDRTIMYSSYKRLVSLFQNSPMMATGKPDAGELALLEPFRAKLDPAVFGEAYVPPVSDGSGSDRALLQQANNMLLNAGCTRRGAALLDPQGAPLKLEFLDSSPALQPHTEPFIANLRRLGIDATARIVDVAQYQQRLNQFEFDIIALAQSGTLTPGDSMRVQFGSQAAKTPGSQNYAGVADVVLDHLIGRIADARDRAALTVAARAFDRVFRAGHYWVPMWYTDKLWFAWRNEFDRPARQPKYDPGAPGTWWWDAKKAAALPGK